MTLSKLTDTIAKLERDYAAFYNLALQCKAAEYLMDNASLSSGLTGQGGVYFREDGDQIDIGLRVSDEVAHVVAGNDPHRTLSNTNLNAFCVIIEEVSHFHLILMRKAANKPVTRLELEWQAEVDKLLFSAALLYEQNSFAHCHHLFRVLYDNAHIVADSPVYEEATKHAARLWSRLASVNGNKNPKESHLVKNLLQQTYRASWQEKLEAIEKVVASG